MCAVDWSRIVLWFDPEFFVHQCGPSFSINVVRKSRMLSVRADYITRPNARATGSRSLSFVSPPWFPVRYGWIQMILRRDDRGSCACDFK
jgi:hypothetical protein